MFFYTVQTLFSIPVPNPTPHTKRSAVLDFQKNFILFDL